MILNAKYLGLYYNENAGVLTTEKQHPCSLFYFFAFLGPTFFLITHPLFVTREISLCNFLSEEIRVRFQISIISRSKKDTETFFVFLRHWRAK